MLAQLPTITVSYGSAIAQNDDDGQDTSAERKRMLDAVDRDPARIDQTPSR